MPSQENQTNPNSIEFPSLASVKCLFIDIGNTTLKPNDNPDEITATLLRAEKSTFDSLGLSLSPRLDDLSFNNSPFEVVLTERKKFTEFLKFLNPQDIQHFNLLLGLQKISDDFSSQISRQTDFSDKELSDEIIQLLAATPEISRQYQRLGFNPESNKLSTYANFIEKKSLKEYLFLEQEGLVTELNNPKNPVNWIKIPSEEEFLGKWKDAITLLKYFRATQNGSGVYLLLKDYLQRSIDLSLVMLNNQDYLKRNHIKNLKAISKKYFSDKK